ncbi:MAG: hypothetical protein Q8P03_01965 [bacterium]|nr:hypothetical protein [bacterium]
MLIFLFGQDTYRSNRKLQELREHYLRAHKESIHLRVLDCQEAVFSSFETELETQSLFQTKKLVVVKNLFQNKEWVERMEEWKKFLLKTEDIIVFFEEGKLAAKGAFFRFLKEHAKTQEFSPLPPASVKAWIAREFSTLGVKAGSGVAEALTRSFQNDLWALSQEIRKLAAFSKSRNSSVTETDAALFLREPLEADIFQTLSLLQQGDKKRGLEKLAEHLEKGESPFYLLSMFSWYARARARDAKTVHEKVFKTDLAMKTGRIDPALALFSLAASL